MTEIKIEPKKGYKGIHIMKHSSRIILDPKKWNIVEGEFAIHIYPKGFKRDKNG
jgi:hypothetical protein